MALTAFEVHGALSDDHRLIRQFGAVPLVYYLFGENVITNTTERDPHAGRSKTKACTNYKKKCTKPVYRATYVLKQILT